MDFVTFRDKKYKVKNATLVLKNKGINSITEIKGLEKFSAIRELNLSDNNISEISGLDHMEYLFNLNLSKNNITEIMGLDKLRNLKFLRLSDNLIQEIKGLDSLKSLMVLYLNGNKIEEVKGLDNLKNLNVLYLAGNKITEVKGIENLPNLKRFDIGADSKFSRKQVHKLEKGGIHTKNQDYFGKRFLKLFMWYCIGIAIASLIFSIAYNVIIKAPPINFLPTFGVIYGLLFIFSPLLYAVGQSY